MELTPNKDNSDVTYFAKTNFRNQMTKFGIKRDDRRRHMYIIGKTGMGKTTLMENMILSDIYNGNGCCYIDPHGDTAEKLIDFIPSWRTNDVVYFNPADLQYPIGFNVFEAVDDRHKHLVASGMMGVFKKIWENMWSSRMEYILNNTLLALLDNPGSTMLGINRMLSDADYRKKMVSNVKDPIVKQFWVKEFASYSERYAVEAVAAIQNKIGQFLSAAVIRNIVAQEKSTIDIREIMDSNKIFIVNLSKGRIGEDNSRLLGGLIITKIQLSAMQRVDTPEEQREDFYLYVDEFQNFATESFANILSEARKYRLSLMLAHQYIAQLTEEVRDAVFGNIGTMVTFRVGAPDAEFIEQEFASRFMVDDIINLPKFNIYLKLLIDGVASQPFSAQTLPPIAKRTESAENVIRVSRQRYARSRELIEDKVARWSGMGADVDTEEMLEKARKKRKNRGKPQHDYTCDDCEKEFTLPVELDRDRPIYCKECLEKRQSGEKDKEGYKYECDRCGDTFHSSVELDRDRPIYCKKCLPIVRKEKEEQTKMKKGNGGPNPSKGEIVAKKAGDETVSLTDLGEKNQQAKSKNKKTTSKNTEEKNNEEKPKSKNQTPGKKQQNKKNAEYTYVCDRCEKAFTLGTKLDRDRPIYCKDCLKKERKKSKKKDDGKNQYNCDRCGDEFRSSTDLDPNRPTYCKPCLKKQRKEKEQAKMEALKAARDEKKTEESTKKDQKSEKKQANERQDESGRIEPPETAGKTQAGTLKDGESVSFEG